MPSAVTDQSPPVDDDPQEGPSTVAFGDQCVTKEVEKAYRQPDLSNALESLRPLPKAAMRKSTRNRRKCRHTAVLTDHDFMEELSTEQKSAKASDDPQEGPSTVAFGDQCVTKEVEKAYRQPVEASISTASDKGDGF
ncbi:hypothetical protein QE152_g5597 [Popillia japonica]|uniref:Uncharacterized protein n=1 Tax=Popillia japonica TaxID=7064 RepID=A0AAW1MLA9_POPJA